MSVTARWGPILRVDTNVVHDHPSRDFDGEDDKPPTPSLHNFSRLPRSTNPGAFLSVPGNKSEDGADLYDGDTTVAVVKLDRSNPDAHLSNNYIMNDPEDLRPNPGTEANFHRADNKFAFTPKILNKLINPKSLKAFHHLGGLAGIERGLRSNRETGLSVDETELDGTILFDSLATAASKTRKPKAKTRSSTRTSNHLKPLAPKHTPSPGEESASKIVPHVNTPPTPPSNNFKRSWNCPRCSRSNKGGKGKRYCKGCQMPKPLIKTAARTDSGTADNCGTAAHGGQQTSQGLEAESRTNDAVRRFPHSNQSSHGSVDANFADDDCTPLLSLPNTSSSRNKGAEWGDYQVEHIGPYDSLSLLDSRSLVSATACCVPSTTNYTSQGTAAQQDSTVQASSPIQLQTLSPTATNQIGQTHSQSSSALSPVIQATSQNPLASIHGA